MSYSVYKHTFPNGKIYIGITCRKPEHRWNHGKGYQDKNKNGEYIQPAIARAIDKYGWENVEHEILYDGLDKEEAEQLEIELIAKHQSNQYEIGYNLAIGGGVPNREPSKLINCIETMTIYESANHAEKETGICARGILDTCKGQQKTAGKMHWEFLDEEKIKYYESSMYIRLAKCADCNRVIWYNIKSQNNRCYKCYNKLKAKLQKEKMHKRREEMRNKKSISKE